MSIELKTALEKITPRWRTRAVAANPQWAARLNDLYPGVLVALQIHSLLTGQSPYCVVCQRPVAGVGRETCSMACRSQHGRDHQASRVKKQKQTLLEKYGVDNISRVPGAGDRRLATMIEKYGSGASELARAKAKDRALTLNSKGRKTLQLKHGVTNPGQLDGHGQKCKDTHLKKHGVDHWTKTEKYQQQLERNRTAQWSNFLPPTIEFTGITKNSNKIKLFANPNLVVGFLCTQCMTHDSAASETVKWRIRETGTCCKTCGGLNTGSAKQHELSMAIKNLTQGVVDNAKVLVPSKKEIDVYLPEYQLGFEFHGLFWHNDLRVDKNFHRDKTVLAADHGIRLIQIFEDEWDHQRSIVLDRIQHLLKKNQIKVAARRCQIVELDRGQAAVFFESNHLQGIAPHSICYGLKFNDQIVAAMSFGHPNQSRGLGPKQDCWELVRFCVVMGHHVMGGASKLLAHFTKSMHPREIYSYADRRWSQGALYQQLGFSFSHNTRPNYWYIDLKNGKRIHRYSLRKKPNEPKDISEIELRRNQGYLRVWDCGSSKWVWTSS